MDVILTYNATQNMHLETLARLADRLPHSEGYIPGHELIPALGGPNKMVLYLESRMAPLTIVHAKHYNPTAIRLLPALRRGI